VIALLGKELRQLLPIAGLWLTVLVIGYATQFIGSRIDEETFGSWFEEALSVGLNPSLAALQALLALVTAWALFPREHDDSTIDFLRGLPVSGNVVFAAKVLAGWSVLLLLTVLSYGIDATLLAWNPESIGGRFYAQPFLALMVRDALFYFVILSHGVVLSWFRVTGLIVYAFYLIGLTWLESITGNAGLFSVLNMLSNQFHGSALVVDRRAITVHVAVACALLLIGLLLWRSTPSAVAGGRQRRRGTAWIGSAVTVAGFVGLGALMLGQLQPGGSTLGESEPLQVTLTDHFRFVHDPADADTVAYVLRHADADFVALGERLGAASLPTVRVNLAATSEHAAGLATWKTILMDLDTFEDDVSQRRVLSHEAVHVMQSVLSERAMSRHAASARFFIEGMAQYLSFAIVPEPERRESNWAIAAVAWQRQEIRFEDLIDSAFAARFDPDLYYSLGDLWSDSFVAVCGPDSLGDFLRAAGRDEVPRRLAPAIFWRDTLAQIDCELEDINAHWRARMQALFEATDRSRFPRFDEVRTARLDDGRVEITARLLADDAVDGQVEPLGRERLPARFMIRIGGSASLVASVDPVFRGEVIEAAAGEGGDPSLGVRFTVPERAIPRERFDYQLGYAPHGDSRVWYDVRRTGSVAP